MRPTLKKFFMASAVIAATVLSTAMARAEKHFTVPFGFTVNGHYCPAGDYTVQHSGTGDAVMLFGEHGTKNFAWVLLPGDVAPNDHRVVLRFDQFGNQYALRQIQYDGLITNDIDRKMRQHDYAKLKPNASSQVTLGQ